MSFGNIPFRRLEPGQGHGVDRSFERLNAPRRERTPERESSAAYSGKSKTDLTVITAEGDRITISLAAQVRYAASSQSGPDGSAQTETTSSSSQLRVSVKGDLSEAELKDLGSLLTKLSEASRQVQQGGAAHSTAQRRRAQSPVWVSPVSPVLLPLLTALNKPWKPVRSSAPGDSELWFHAAFSSPLPARRGARAFV